MKFPSQANKQKTYLIDSHRAIKNETTDFWGRKKLHVKFIHFESLLHGNLQGNREAHGAPITLVS